MAKKKKMKPISFERQMNSLVRINDAAILDEEGADYIKLKIKLTHSWFAKVIGFLYRLRDYKKHLLTGFNYELYSLIKSEPIRMRDLIQWFIDREKLSFFEARTLMMQYVGNMMQRALIVVELPPEEPEEEETK
ncbi:MAG: hypothetical protein IJ992_04655 [Lentisphaeria bacterium]|nr:hypothetical protein [Lentisphaeria bacterium]